MSGPATPPPTFRSAWLLGLWGLATWSVLRLHDAPIGGEHSICGPWGCGPTIPALLGAHGFWLLVAIPGAIIAARWLPRGRANALGWALFWLGIVGLGVLSIGAWRDRPEVAVQGAGSYTVERILFAIATTVDVPIVPLGLAGLVLMRLGRGPSPSAARPGSARADGPGGACGDPLCGGPGPGSFERPAGRVEVGKMLPNLTLFAPDGTLIQVPASNSGRASILYFMRASGCSTCRSHVRALVGMAERLRDPGLGVIVVHPGDDATSRTLADAFPLTFASGRAPGTYERLGLVDRVFGLSRGCGTILVDEIGIVQHARLVFLPFGAFSEPELIEACRSFRAAPPMGSTGPSIVPAL